MSRVRKAAATLAALPRCAVPAHNARTTSSAAPLSATHPGPGQGHRFGDFPVFPSGPVEARDELLGGGGEEDLERTPGQADGLAGGLKVDKLNVITSKSGAFSGFPVAKGIDLNVPGPHNDTATTGSCVNVHQMQFHLAKGDPAEVKLIRKVIRVAKAAGQENRKGEKDKPADDGPSAGSVIRPKDSSSVVVADAPGFIGKGDASKADASKADAVFPVSYDADFNLYAIDLVQPRILAKLSYTVSISKKSFGDAAPVNEIKEKSRKLY